ncbi:MAG: cytochrome b/b6 domain-containing protein [Terriglobales bacterium]|jgi:cytochrome b subunit of formate dehydrogenase
MKAEKQFGWLLRFSLALAILWALPALAADQDCLACHGDPGMKSDSGKSLHVDPAKHKSSVHGDLGCTFCHEGVKEYPHPKPMRMPTCATCHADETAQVPKSVHSILGAEACASCHGKTHDVQHADKVVPEQCATCHEDAVKGFQLGVHAIARKAGDMKTPTCLSCHGSPHQIVAADDPKSPVHHNNIPATCASCHSKKPVMETVGETTQQFYSYEQSVHGQAVANGSTKAAVCTDCHGVHEIRRASDEKSSIFKFNVPMTCAKCHESVKTEFMASIHGQAITRGNSQAPVCTDCHGIHSIKSHLDPNSPVNAQNLAKITCARCHEGVRLSQELGVESGRASSYLASYHGLASERGSQIVANCASCHGVHNILPSSDPRSTISPANLVKTCGQCHPGVTEKFTLGKVHVDAPLSADIGSKAVRWIRSFYLLMILSVIGSMVLHNLIIWRRKAIILRDRYPRTITRMNPSQRWQHLTLLISFITLVITGFALKYPDSWLSLIPGMGERVRGIIHRTAGVVMIGAGTYHLIYLFLTRDGRKMVMDMLPAPKDATDAMGVMRYYLGLGGAKPEFKRFTYAEKAEYWALVWGVIVMATTGIALWAKVTVGHLFPRWWIDVATAVHLYEAILATLAIIVWHFYQIFLDPDVYPMNWAWWDGKVSAHHYQEEHGLDSETLLAAARADSANGNGHGNGHASAIPDEDEESEPIRHN